MSENNPFELVMQQKLEGFRIEPAPADWQAIYDRLHPRSKRRIIWWWFPLIAALGAGTFWAYHSNINSPAAIIAARPVVPDDKVLYEQQTDKASASIKEDKSSNSQQGEKDPSSQNKGGINSAVALHQADQIRASSNAKTPNTNIEDNRNKKSTPVNVPQATALSAKDESPKMTGSATDPIKKENLQATKNSNPSVAVDKKDSPQTSKASITVPLITTAPVEKKSNEGETANIEEKKPAKEAITILEEKKVAEEAATIPAKKKVLQWQWAAYLGAGPNYPVEPISLAKTAMAANAPDYSSGSSRTYITTSNNNGWHFSAGMTAEKKMGNNWLFATGIGMNSNTWKTIIEKYRDSVFNGSLSSSNKIFTEKNNYQLWMAEIPLQFSNRIAGKKTGSLWWTIGLNNQFRLGLNRKSSIDSVQGNQLSDRKSVTSTARFYQPQLRLGLLYNHDARLHWQIQPIFQYTLGGVYPSGTADNPVLVNLQLQYRLFLQRKNESGN
jgi:hypothetical protein